MRILFLPEALAVFNELATVLHEKSYFGFEGNALKYVDDLAEDIKNTLHTRINNPARIIFIATKKECASLHFAKAKLFNGMCSSRHIKKKEKLFI